MLPGQIHSSVSCAAAFFFLSTGGLRWHTYKYALTLPTWHEIHNSVLRHSKTNIKKLVAMKDDSCVVRLTSPFVWANNCPWTNCKDYSWRPTSTYCTFCSCGRGKNSPYQQLVVVCNHYSKRETRRPGTVNIQTIRLVQYEPGLHGTDHRRSLHNARLLGLCPTWLHRMCTVC